MPDNQGIGGSAGEQDNLRQIAAELKRLNDRFEPVPWYKLDMGRPLGYGLVGFVFLLLGFGANEALKGSLLIAGAIFFVAQSIAASRLKR